MARRVFSFPVRSEGGPVLGGTATELRIYDDAALTTLSTIYAAETGVTTIPNPRIPNAGRQTALLADRLTTDTFVTVVDITGFNVGDLIPIYNGTVTAYRVITIITAGTRRFDLDAALGTAFLAANTVVGNLDMKGHVYGWLDDVRDYYMQSKNVASTRVLPPVGIPVRVPATTVGTQEEGVSTGTARATINFTGTDVTATDDAVNARVNVAIQGSPTGALVAWLTDAAPTNWLLCYGQSVSRATYAALYAVIGTVFGVGDGSTTFNLPDTRGRVMVGQDDMGGVAANRLAAANALAVTGGASTHTLTTAELPSHSHSHTHGSHQHTYSSTQGTDQQNASSNTKIVMGNVNDRTPISPSAETPAADATPAGSGSAHNNVQPYLTVNYIVRT